MTNSARDNQWLLSRFIDLKDKYFSDVKFDTLYVKFGQKARTRLGSIKQDQKSGKVTITITGYFKNEIVPVEVVDAVLAHEMTHYAHGFCSPLPKKLRHPHLGGAVDKEMIAREMGDLLIFQKKWTKMHWNEIIGPVVRRRRRYTYRSKNILRSIFGL